MKQKFFAARNFVTNYGVKADVFRSHKFHFNFDDLGDNKVNIVEYDLEDIYDNEENTTESNVEDRVIDLNQFLDNNGKSRI